jgi:hypothetical protein
MNNVTRFWVEPSGEVKAEFEDSTGNTWPDMDSYMRDLVEAQSSYQLRILEIEKFRNTQVNNG